MEKIHYFLGLPRTCSTVITRLLNQNPRVFASNTCGTPYFFHFCGEAIHAGLEFHAMDMNLLNKCYKNFLYQGMKGWYETLTDKPIIMSKSRVWMDYLPQLFAIDNDSKFIFTVRDLRDILCSYEALTWKHVHLKGDIHKMNFENRIKNMTDPNSPTKLGPWLERLPSFLEAANRYPDKIKFIRQEEFTHQPEVVLEDIYEFIGEKNYKHDLDNIPDAPYTEHDNSYRQPITHEVGKKFKNIKSKWVDYYTKPESDWILENFNWYFRLFYPEELE